MGCRMCVGMPGYTRTFFKKKLHTLSWSTLALMTRLTHVGWTSTSTRDESRCRGKTTSSTTHPPPPRPPRGAFAAAEGPLPSSSSVSRREKAHFPSFFCLTAAASSVLGWEASPPPRPSLSRTYLYTCACHVTYIHPNPQPKSQPPTKIKHTQTHYLRHPPPLLLLRVPLRHGPVPSLPLPLRLLPLLRGRLQVHFGAAWKVGKA